jgi:hypothetical protein
MRVSSDSNRQSRDLQRDALLAAGRVAAHPSERALTFQSDGKMIDRDALVAGLELG